MIFDRLSAGLRQPGCARRYTGYCVKVGIGAELGDGTLLAAGASTPKHSQHTAFGIRFACSRMVATVLTNIHVYE